MSSSSSPQSPSQPCITPLPEALIALVLEYLDLEEHDAILTEKSAVSELSRIALTSRLIREEQQRLEQQWALYQKMKQALDDAGQNALPIRLGRSSLQYMLYEADSGEELHWQASLHCHLRLDEKRCRSLIHNGRSVLAVEDLFYSIGRRGAELSWLAMLAFLCDQDTSSRLTNLLLERLPTASTAQLLNVKKFFDSQKLTHGDGYRSYVEFVLDKSSRPGFDAAVESHILNGTLPSLHSSTQADFMAFINKLTCAHLSIYREVIAENHLSACQICLELLGLHARYLPVWRRIAAIEESHDEENSNALNKCYERFSTAMQEEVRGTPIPTAEQLHPGHPCLRFRVTSSRTAASTRAER